LSENWTTFGGFAGSAYGTLVQYVRVAEHTAGEPVNELLRLKRNHLN